MSDRRAPHSGRPRRPRGRSYRVRVRGERRAQIDFAKLSRALLEQAALEAHRVELARHDADASAREVSESLSTRTSTELTDESEEVGDDQGE